MSRRLLLALSCLLACACGPLEEPAAAPAEAAVPRATAPSRAGLRIVSLNPSLTSILLALGARDTLVGVDEFSAAQQPSVAGLPRVGGLFNPSLEAVAALEPDAVVVVPSVEQRDFVGRLGSLGVRVLVLHNIRFEEVLDDIAQLGALVGRDVEASRRIDEIRAVRRAAEALTTDRPHPRTLVVLQRDPVFVVGRGGFIDELLTATGALNLGAEFDEPYPQVAVEWLIDAAPEVLIDMTDDVGPPLEYWSRWPAIPAVASGRVLHLDPQVVALPGPYLDRSIRTLVEALHGSAVAAKL